MLILPVNTTGSSVTSCPTAKFDGLVTGLKLLNVVVVFKSLFHKVLKYIAYLFLPFAYQSKMH